MPEVGRVVSSIASSEGCQRGQLRRAANNAVCGMTVDPQTLRRRADSARLTGSPTISALRDAAQFLRVGMMWLRVHRMTLRDGAAPLRDTDWACAGKTPARTEGIMGDLGPDDELE